MMKVTSLLLLGSIVMVACTAPVSEQASPDEPSTAAVTSSNEPSAAATGTPRPTARVTPSPSPLCSAGPGEVTVRIPARSNLFGAGIETAPAPGAGGGGVLPILVDVPSGGGSVVTLSCVDGLTNCCADPPGTGPAGDPGQSTDVESTGGIAGLVVRGRAMFLAGVFIGDEPPAGPAPERLDLTGRLDETRIEPGLHQTFFIGDGVDRSIIAPDGATRLYLGFVDAFGFLGKPGWYANNRGFLDAAVKVTPG